MSKQRHSLFAGVLICAAVGTSTAEAFDAAQYYNENCTRCHGSEVFTRDNRRVQSFTALENQVARCDAMLETQLFPEDLAQLVEHLNTNFYKFSH